SLMASSQLAGDSISAEACSSRRIESQTANRPKLKSDSAWIGDAANQKKAVQVSLNGRSSPLLPEN
ncbi:hypothetical protein, partial [Mesorhizobium sp.]|uniref:hypothetical protein n=1 Tax=Mesorhizobium sp. TaxID=1871066 RepID=UPI0025BBFC76